MKRIQRITAAVIVCVLLLSLCACNPDLDELRKTSGYLVDGNIVMMDGTVYKPINYPTLDPLLEDDYVNVCEDEDVPLLLIGLYGKVFYKSVDGVFLQSAYYGFYEYYTTYVREDHYDQVMKLCEEGADITTYRYNYEFQREEHVEMLTEEQAETLRGIVDKMEWSYTQDMYETMAYEFDDKQYHCLKIQSCNREGWFVGDEVLCLAWNPEKEELLLFSNDDMFTMSDERYFSYVPYEYVSEISEIFNPVLEAAKEAMNGDEDEYYYGYSFKAY